MSIICYDTLVTSRRSNYVEAARLVEADTHLVIDRSASKRLSWESQYTSHSSHYSSPSIPQPASMDRSEQTRYFIIACMAPIKYLGLTLDGRWPCASYFAQLRPWAGYFRMTKGRILHAVDFMSAYSDPWLCMVHPIAHREMSPICHECDVSADSVHHTLSECLFWALQRRRERLLSSVVGAMVFFCKATIALKETAERVHRSRRKCRFTSSQ